MTQSNYCSWCEHWISDPIKQHVESEHPEKLEDNETPMTQSNAEQIEFYTERLLELTDSDSLDELAAYFGHDPEEEEEEDEWPKTLTVYAHSPNDSENAYELAEEHADRDENRDLYTQLRGLAYEVELTYRLHEDETIELCHVDAGGDHELGVRPE